MSLTLTFFLLTNNWLHEDQCGWGNGYIVLPKGHKFHGKYYDDIMSEVDTCEELTYSEPDEEGNWVIGWDSAHYGQTKDNYPFSKVLSQTRCIQKLDKDKHIVPARTTMPRDEFEKLFGDIK